MGVVYARDSSAARARATRATHARFAEFEVYIGAMTQFGLSSAGMLASAGSSHRSGRVWVGAIGCERFFSDLYILEDSSMLFDG